MSETMSQEAIAALVEAARSGEEIELPVPAAGRRARRLRRMDFTRPTKFTSDQERRIHRAMEAFCRAATTRMSAELRAQVEFEVIGLDQLGWSAAHSALPGDAVGVTLLAGPEGRRVLFAAEQPFVTTAVELLLGGTSPGSSGARRLGDIDWALSTLLFEHIVSQLSPVWEDLCGLTLDVDRLEPASETSHLSAVSEPTLVVTMEARLRRRSSAFVLLVPHAAVAAVADALSGATDRGRGDEADPDADAAVRAVHVVARAEVARVRVTLDDVLALRPGDLVRLEAPTSAGVELCVEDTAVFRCRPGRLDARRAVRIEGLLEDGA